MNKAISLFIILAISLSSFGQDVKKYILIENKNPMEQQMPFYKLTTIKDGSEKYIDLVHATKSYLYIEEKSVIKKIKVSEIDLTKISKNYLIEKDININQSLFDFSKQAKIGLAIQLFSPAIPLILKNEIGLYSALGLGIIGTIIHISSFNHLRNYALISEAVDY
jgi:hypothetical protein